MALNPITSNPVLTNTQELRQSQESKQNEAGRILAEDVGKNPMNARFAGHTKVFFYQLTNFVTLGILGQIGKACAQSSCMGSSNSSNWARDLGQTYLNATQDQGKVMGFLNRAWTEGIGRLALVGLAFDAARHFKPQEKYQGSFKGPHSIHELGQIQNAAKPIWAKVDDEIRAIEGEYSDELAERAVITGSDELKAMFEQHLRSEFAEENGLFYAWSHPVVEKTNPKNPKHDPNFQLNKAEAAEAAIQFIRNGGAYSLNCSSKNRKSALAALATAFGTDPKDPKTLENSKFIKTYLGTKQEIKTAETELQSLKLQAPETEQGKEDLAKKIAQVAAAKQTAENNLAMLTKEVFSPQQTKAIGQSMAGVEKDIVKNLQDSLTRFTAVASSRVAAGQGYSPAKEAHLRNKASSARTQFREALKEAGVPGDHAANLSQKTFGKLSDLPTKKLMKRGLVDHTLQKLKAPTEKLVSVAKGWQDTINEKKALAVQTLVEKGLSKADAEAQTEAWLAPKRSQIPAQEILTTAINLDRSRVQNSVDTAVERAVKDLEDLIESKIDSPETKNKIAARAVLDDLNEDLQDIREAISSFFEPGEASLNDNDVDIDFKDPVNELKKLLESVDGLINAAVGELDEVGLKLDEVANKIAEQHQKLKDANHADEAANFRLDQAGNMINNAKNELIKLDANNEEVGEIY